jgi:hypothetical protein
MGARVAAIVVEEGGVGLLQQHFIDFFTGFERGFSGD